MHCTNVFPRCARYQIQDLMRAGCMFEVRITDKSEGYVDYNFSFYFNIAFNRASLSNPSSFVTSGAFPAVVTPA